MKKLSVLLALIACFYFLSCKKDLADSKLVSSDASASKAKKSYSENDEGVPFKGTYTNTHEVLEGPPIFKQRVTGLGNATHLGNSNFVAISTVDLTTPPPFAVSGTRTFTAANGDQIHTSFTGTSTPMGPGSSGANLHDVIVGGTGRFQNASGSFDAVAINDPSTSTFSVTFNGYIKF